MQPRTTFYKFLHWCVRRTFRFAYRRFECEGIERIPTNDAVIFAPNHTNGLMDALALVWLSKKYRQILFVARADIFRNKRVAKLLRSFRMLPIMRIRDGRENLSKNNAIMSQCVEALQEGIPFCIMPEGTHRAKRSQLPLVKGIFRIALMANEQLQGVKNVYIVPVGINFGSFFRYRSSLLLKVGKPINVTAFAKENAELSFSEQTMQLRAVLTEQLQAVHLAIPEGDDFDAIEECCFLDSDRNDSLDERLERSQQLLKKIEKAKTEQPEIMRDFFAQVKAFARLRKRWHVYADALSYRASSLKLFGVALLLLLEIPYFFVSLLVMLPYLLISEFLVRWQSDNAMYNSIRYVLSLISYPISMIVAVAICFSSFKWWLALCLLVLLVPSYLFFYDYLRLVRLCYSSLVLRYNRELRDMLQRLKNFPHGL